MLSVFITYAVGFLTCIPLRLYYRGMDFRSRSVLHIALVVLVGSFVAANVWYWLDVFLSMFTSGVHEVLASITLMRYLRQQVYSYLVILAWSGLYFSVKFLMEWRYQQERAEKADLLAQSAQLQMLRYQLNPHFLFNALNSIRALIEEDTGVARTMVTELSEFLRYSLISRNAIRVPLRKELEALRHYCEIQKIRYEEKLEVTFDIDPAAEDFPVLSFLVYPLVENAVKYGMQSSPMPLRINLKAAVIDESLKLDVANTGRWIPPASARSDTQWGTGTGLENVRRRLEHAFAGNYRLDVTECDGWVHMALEIHKDHETDHERTAQGSYHR